ncbi:hypothetical protein [Acidithiobacillus sp.]|uniref:hypothetical protein n=1 Tax=Acidithiobacillus sp. TaxID=1872118 RepID=UPI0026376529|nr:hypothetical protein [Acidithiobacillus sp.]MDD2749906.1 hypothetical protein [Acidithiobacillus sp.]MDD5280151.1 hypothetical protein [Acidithiobacillus sp.]
MSIPPYRGGSSVSARSVIPSVRLAKLAELIAMALPPTQDEPQAALPLLSVRNGQIVVNTRGVLVRLYRNHEFKQFKPDDGNGFILDMEPPPRGTTARVGGRLQQGTEVATTKNLEKVYSIISDLVDEAMKCVDPGSLAITSMDETLQRMADSVKERKPSEPSTASLVPVLFASNDRRPDERLKDVGKVLTAIETVDGPDRLELLCGGIANKLRKEGMEDDEIDETLAAIRAQRNRQGSQIRDFLDFIDDEALSRVRLQVTMGLMDALRGQSSKSGFKAYVRQVKDCFAQFAGVKGEALLLDPSLIYGQQNVSDLAEHLRKAMFYACLPVWAEGSAQLFETRTEPAQGVATLREVSYRFRVNGNNPLTGKSAFESRLEHLRERLFDNEEKDVFVRRDIAELVFLYLVIPDSIDQLDDLDVVAAATRIAEQMKKDPDATLRDLHNTLVARVKVVRALATELIDLLRNKVNKVVTRASDNTERFTVSVHRSIVNWEAVDSIGQKADILVKSERADDHIAWFQHITISQEPVVAGSIASYTVKTELVERSLTVAGDAYAVAMSRDMAHPVVPIRFVPYRWLKEEQEWIPDLVHEGYFKTGAGIEVQYDLEMFRLRRNSDDKVNARSEQLRSASITAFALTVYVVLWELQRRVRAEKPDVALSMLRLQHTGRKLKKEDDAKDPNTAVYAVSHALERALAREGTVKLQGLTTQADAGGSHRNLEWKRKGALHAMLGGQPLRFAQEGSLDKVALLTYVTRPCDSHPAYADADGYLFVSRTYTTERQGDTNVLRARRMRSRLVESRQEFKNPQPILEEIARLRADGFRHVMLLSHHYGSRHIGRAAERHAPHGTLEFLDAAMKRFEDMHLYTLRRDVFPATRLRQRRATESGFEVASFKEHQAMYASLSQEALRSVMPIYTFATLAVVGEEKERPQSGFCTYFYEAEQRVANSEAAKIAEMNILGIGQASGIRKSLVSVLRAIHFMESEKPATKSTLLPVLDPFDWANPTKATQSGEIEIMNRRGRRAVLLSLPAILTHVTQVLYKEIS